MSSKGGLAKSEDDLTQLEAHSDSFWDIGNYRKVVKRIDDGAKLCSDLSKMIQERSEIEAKYVRHLQQWSKKWDEIITKGPEYGSIETGCKAATKEAMQLADVHSEISQRLQKELVENLQAWKADNFHKSLMTLKETKKAEEGFTTAQKPWTKRLQKNARAKKSYHHAGKELELLEAALHEAETNDDISPEQCTRTREKTERAETVVEKALGKYKERLGDLQHYKSRYIEDMTMQFCKCQEAEHARMEFFKNTLVNFKKIIDISKNTLVTELYKDFGETLSRVSPEEDLRWYAVHCGTGMNYLWPEFEKYIPGQTATQKTHPLTMALAKKYSPSLRSNIGISRSQQSSTTSTSSRPHSITSSQPHTSASSHPHSITNGATTSSSGTQSRKSDYSSMASSSDSSSPILNARRSQGAGFDSAGEDDSVKDEWLEPPPIEPMKPGSRSSSEEPQGYLMRALYDYSGSQEDDLGFKEGDLVRIMYEGKDGWAEGLMADKYGYVPIGYFEPI